MTPTTLPKHYKAIQQKSRDLNFDQISEDEVGVLLRLLVSSKPFATVLELGTGTGMGLAWLAEGLHPEGNLVTVEKDKTLLEVAHSLFKEDNRIEFVNLDASEWIEKNKEARFDLVFADTWAGKFTDLEAVLKMVKPNCFYLIDDLNYQAHWPGYHQEKVLFLVKKLKCHPEFYTFPIDVGTGLMLLCRK